MWVQLQIPRIEDGNNFGVAVQVILKFEGFGGVFFCSSYLTEMMVTFKRYCCNSIGKGIRAAYQHPHQDRRVPDTDHEVSDAAHVQTFRIPAQKHFKTKSKHATHTDPWNNRAQVMVEFEKLWPLLEEKG